MIRLTYDQIKVLDRISERVGNESGRLVKFEVAQDGVGRLIVTTSCGHVFVIWPGGPFDEYIDRGEG